MEELIIFCSSDQMMRAIADGTAGAEVKAARQPVAWRDAHDHATFYYEHPGEGYEVEPLYLSAGVNTHESAENGNG